MRKRSELRGSGRRSPRLTEEEQALWRYVTRADRPISGVPEDGIEGTPPPEEPETATDPQKTRRRRVAPPSAPKGPAAARPAPTRSGPGLDKRSAQRLRRGKTPIEGRLDLHGMIQAEAHSALNAYIIGAQASGKRCVLVITGKGVSRDGFSGTLRSLTPRWLGEIPLRDLVLRYSEATAKDGGAGALYVLLRRRR